VPSTNGRRAALNECRGVFTVVQAPSGASIAPPRRAQSVLDGLAILHVGQRSRTAFAQGPATLFRSRFIS
jgi:hypothetical protein